MMVVRPTMSIPSLVFALIAIEMTLQSCIYSSAFSISPSFVTLHLQRPGFLIGSPSRSKVALSTASSSDDEEESQKNKKVDLPDYDNEEILLKIHLAMHPGISTKDAMQAVATYSQSFPFAAVLPVQPLTYLPTPDDGVEIKFLRKKTTEKSAVDGGIRFFVKEIQETTPVIGDAATTTLSFKDSSRNDVVGEEDDDEEEEEEECPMDSNGKCLLGGLEITAKRNSVGQTIRKLMAERLVVTAYVAGITGVETEKYGSPPIDQVYVTSVYHKWM